MTADPPLGGQYVLKASSPSRRDLLKETRCQVDKEQARHRGRFESWFPWASDDPSDADTHWSTNLRRQMLDDQLEAVSDAARKEQLTRSAALLEQLTGGLKKSSLRAAGKRKFWGNIARSSGALTAVAAAVAGGSLAGKVSGTTALVIGVLALLLGVLAAILGGLGAEETYERSRIKRRDYDELWWEAWNYTIYELASDSPTAAKTKIDEFVKRRFAIGEP